jgi:hypothetical protein
MKSKEAVQRRLAKYWNTILLWSGYERYMEVRDIAYVLRIEPRTVSRRIEWFKKHYPEAYEKIKADRKTIKTASLRLDRQLEDMKEGRFTSLDAMSSDISDSLIKEKF